MDEIISRVSKLSDQQLIEVYKASSARLDGIASSVGYIGDDQRRRMIAHSKTLTLFREAERVMQGRGIWAYPTPEVEGK